MVTERSGSKLLSANDAFYFALSSDPNSAHSDLVHAFQLGCGVHPVIVFTLVWTGSRQAAKADENTCFAGYQAASAARPLFGQIVTGACS